MEFDRIFELDAEDCRVQYGTILGERKSQVFRYDRKIYRACGSSLALGFGVKNEKIEE